MYILSYCDTRVSMSAHINSHKMHIFNRIIYNSYSTYPTSMKIIALSLYSSAYRCSSIAIWILKDLGKLLVSINILLSTDWETQAMWKRTLRVLKISSELKYIAISNYMHTTCTFAIISPYVYSLYMILVSTAITIAIEYLYLWQGYPKEDASWIILQSNVTKEVIEKDCTLLSYILVYRYHRSYNAPTQAVM